MGQEFTINSRSIEDKINLLLPSQGGDGTGIDFSASTMIIPIIDVTEAASGAGLRQDLQKSLSFTGITAFSVSGGSVDTTIINTTGYWLVTFLINIRNQGILTFKIGDGVSLKTIYQVDVNSSASNQFVSTLNLYLGAGDIFVVNSSSTDTRVTGNYRQIASLDGTLQNPS